MAQLILTGKHEAIQLKGLHGQEVLQLDKHKADLIERNGGFADFLIEIRRGICRFLRIQNETYPLIEQHKVPTA